jgi:alkanesulfonate monooxygenase SsuD/methylene tetrahydromethanopterin reductase-like flavin-dependent oxidoreductase (luciferase family)
MTSPKASLRSANAVSPAFRDDEPTGLTDRRAPVTRDTSRGSDSVEHFAQVMSDRPDAVTWLRRREAEGWHGVSVGDHIAGADLPYPHAWVTVGQWAAASTDVRIATAFGNNLIRSPVEFAHAALTAQAASDGRFEAGLGAGWSAADVEPCGMRLPTGPERARRYLEAAVIVRDLLQRRACSFHGEFYDIEVAGLTLRVADPPPLVLAVGGPWVTEHVGPLADRLEVVPFAHVIRAGAFDVPAFARGSPRDVVHAVDRARAVNPAAPIHLGLFVAAGQDAHVDRWVAAFAGGPLEGLAGEPARVADTLAAYAELGVSRCTLSALTPRTYENLASALRP